MHTITWSLEAITKKAEQRITRLMAKWMAKSNQVLDPKKALLLRGWAYSVFLLWNDITLGWQNNGNTERLEALTNRKEE